MYESSKIQFEYANQFITDNYINIFIKIIQRTEGEIASLGYILIGNLCVSSKELIKRIYESDILKTSFNKFKSGTANYAELRESIRFFALLCKEKNTFALEHVLTFFRLFDSVIRQGEDPEILFYALGGIHLFITNDIEHHNELISLLLQLNTIEKVFQIEDEKMQSRGLAFSFYATDLVEIIIDVNYSNVDALYQITLRNNLPNVFNGYLLRYKSNKIRIQILEVINKLVLTRDIRIILLFVAHPIIDIFAEFIKLNEYTSSNLICKLFNVFYSLNDCDVNTILYQKKIIDQLIDKLQSEKISENITYLLECVCYFIQSEDNTKGSSPFVVYCQNIGIEDVLNKQTSFNESHFGLIDKIRTFIANAGK